MAMINPIPPVGRARASEASVADRSTAQPGNGSFPKQCCEGNSNLTGCVDSDMRTLSTNLSISGACQ